MQLSNIPVECSLCKIEYVGEAKTPFDICVNNHTSNVSDPNAFPGCHHFGCRQFAGDSFNYISTLCESSNRI